MKKLLLKLGAIVAVIAPVTAVVACGVQQQKNDSNKNTIAAKLIGEAVKVYGPNYKELNDQKVSDKLFSEALKATETEKTDHDFIRVGGPDLSVISDGIVDVQKATYKEADVIGKPEYKQRLGEFRAGDYFEFVFKDAVSIKSFAKRVVYMDGSSTINKNAIKLVGPEFTGEHVLPEWFNQIRGIPFIKKDDSIVASDEQLSSDTSRTSSLFNLSTPKRNVVRMTFNDVIDDGGNSLVNQRIFVKGFGDQNNDGETNFNDNGMTLPFMIDKGDFPVYTTSSWHGTSKAPITVRGMHTQHAFGILKDLYDEGLKSSIQAKAAAVTSVVFDEDDVVWSPKIDMTNLKLGDVIEFVYDGFERIVRIIEKNGNKRMCFADGSDYGPDSIKVLDINHIEMPNPKANNGMIYIGSGKWGKADPEKVEITKMGTVR